MDDDHGGADADEAFGALSDPARLDVLRALWDADGALSFSTLRERVGMRDSGRFNYHLGELVGRFVARTDDGYCLRLAGQHVVGSLLAGVYGGSDAVATASLDEPCPTCGGERTFRYEDEQVTVACAGCDVVSAFPVPPGAFAGYDRERLPAVAARYARTYFQRAAAGFCPYCEGRVDPALRSVRDSRSDDTPDADRLASVPKAEYDCRRCGEALSADLRTVLLDHPEVVAFYRDHGVDVRELTLWDVSSLDPDRTAVTGREPPRATATFEAGGERLTLTVDGSLSVVDHRREA